MGGSAAETPASSTPASSAQPLSGVRASDADRDHVVSRLRDEFVAGRLSQETFLHRVHAVLETKQQADLPPLLADLPRQQNRSLGTWFRRAWGRLGGAADPAAPGEAQPRGQAADAPGNSRRERWTSPRTVSPRAARNVTTSLSAAGDVAPPLPLQFPRDSGNGTPFSIGRDPGCDLAIADMTVSRMHATLERTPDGWLLTDLESTNGTRVNGWRVRGKVAVRAGDLVSFGNLETVFSRGDELAVARREERATSSMF